VRPGFRPGIGMKRQRLHDAVGLIAMNG